MITLKFLGESFSDSIFVTNARVAGRKAGVDNETTQNDAKFFEERHSKPRNTLNTRKLMCVLRGALE